MKNIIYILVFLTGGLSLFAQNQPALIVIVAPSINEVYYAPVFDSIISYDIDFVNTVNNTTTDRAIILADNATIPYLKPGLPDSVILQADVSDVWIRDFSPVKTSQRVKFDYRPNYLTLQDANFIDNSFRNWFSSAGLVNDFDSPIILDGGNFVWNMAGRAIITTRIFSDNPGYTTNQIETLLKTKLNLQQIAFLPEEFGDVTGHSDGMVMFIDTNEVLVNTYSDTNFRAQVMNALNTAFPGINITEVPYNYDTTSWGGFPSACGIFLNSLVTENYIYLPVYNMQEDSTMINLFQYNTTKTVVPVNAEKVCFMGGSVRCPTWAVYGNDAETLKNLAAQDVPEIKNSGQSFSVFPNPASKKLVVKFGKKLKTSHEIRISDMDGRLVKSIENVNGEKLNIDIGDLRKGAYSIQLLNSKGLVSTEKLIIE